MAKRRKVSDESDVFQEPEFDEVQFLKDEILKAKGIILVFVLAMAVGIVSAYLQVFGGDILAYAFGIVVAFSLKWILGALHLGFKDNKTWAFAIISFVLIWIAIWSVGLNPPFNDVSPPQVRTVEVWNGTAWVMVYSYQESFNAQLTKKIKENIKSLDWNNVTKVRAKVTDNVAVAQVEINSKTARAENGYYMVDVEPPITDITVIAWDTSQHHTRLVISR